MQRGPQQSGDSQRCVFTGLRIPEMSSQRKKRCTNVNIHEDAGLCSPLFDLENSKCFKCCAHDNKRLCDRNPKQNRVRSSTLDPYLCQSYLDVDRNLNLNLKFDRDINLYEVCAVRMEHRRICSKEESVF